MAQNSIRLVMTPESLQFMRSHPPPPPSPSNKLMPGSFNLNALRPPVIPSNEWNRPYWFASSNVMDRFARDTRLIRSRWDGSQNPVKRVPHFLGRGRDQFYTKRNNQRFQGPRCKEDANPSGMSCHTDAAKVGNGPSDCRNKPGPVAIKVEASSTGIENSMRSPVKKKRPISKFHPAKPWNREDAEKAMKVEMEADRKQAKTLIIKFPDPELSSHIIKSYHNSIDKVYFLAPSGPRFCFIQIAEDSDIQRVMNELNEMDFHNLGKLKVEKKCEKGETNFDPEYIDPYTLYVGNLPITINPTIIKEMFPTSVRIDVGFAQRLKNTRYAFITYQTVEESIEAFKSCYNVTLDKRNLIIRFRRQKRKRTALGNDIEKKLVRKEIQKLIKGEKDMEDLKNLEKKIKKEKIDVLDEEPTLNDVIGNDEALEGEPESEEEEKEVDDEDVDDDDEECHENAFEYAFEWSNENGGNGEDEDEEEEEEDEDEDDDDDDDDDE